MNRLSFLISSLKKLGAFFFVGYLANIFLLTFFLLKKKPRATKANRANIRKYLGPGASPFVVKRKVCIFKVEKYKWEFANSTIGYN